MLFPEIHSHPDCLHIHQIPDFLHSLMSHAGPLGNQLFIEFDPGRFSVTANQKPVICAAGVGETDIKSIIPVIHLLIINLTYIIPSGCHITKFHRFPVSVLNLEFRPGLGCLSNHPAIQLYGIFPDSYYIYLILHQLFVLFPLYCPNSDALPQ